MKEYMECDNVGAKSATRSGMWWGDREYQDDKWNYQNGLFNLRNKTIKEGDICSDSKVSR